MYEKHSKEMVTALTPKGLSCLQVQWRKQVDMYPSTFSNKPLCISRVHREGSTLSGRSASDTYVAEAASASLGATCALRAGNRPQHAPHTSECSLASGEATKNLPEKSRRRNGIAKKRTQRADPHPTRHVDRSLFSSALPIVAVGPGTLCL
jgi:hypothetical protein